MLLDSYGINNITAALTQTKPGPWSIAEKGQLGLAVSRYNMKKDKRGFTLIELSLASAILVLALSGLLILFNYCYTLSMQAANTVTAVTEAYGRLEEIRLHNYDDIVTDYDHSTFALAQLSGSGTIDINDDTPDHSGQLLEVTVVVTWLEKSNRAISLSLVSKIAERY